MAIAHSCHVCGHSLTRVWAPLDPIYGLPVVVCPSCNAACVRRRPVVSDIWRQWRRTAASARALGLRCGGGVVVIASTFGCAMALVDEAHQMGPLELGWTVLHPPKEMPAADVWLRDYRWWIIGVFVGWFVLLGTLVSGGLSHLSRRRAWALFAAAIAGMALLMLALGTAAELSTGSAAALQAAWDESKNALGLVLIGLVLTPLGIMPGRWLGRMSERSRARRWKRRLARRRRMRRNA